MGAVHHIIRSKGSAVFSIRPDITVFKALEIMLEKNVSSLVVMEDEKLIGIFTERDYARKVTLKGKTSKETPVG
ncbi:MAG: CBS domain-containing protein, partial [Ferruginibacter sp.]